MIKKERISNCSVCESKDLSILLDLPSFPQIGIYLEESADESDSPCVDNALHICNDCGHVQMEYALDPGFLYSTDFQHKTSQSASAMQANDFLFEVIEKSYGDLHDKTIAEVGCNDTFFLQKFVDKYQCKVIGVDPTLEGNEDTFLAGLNESILPYFSVFGDFIENIDFNDTCIAKPDVVVSNFVFEHLQHPLSIVNSMLDCVNEGGICVIGVPTLEFMAYNCRFDQMSHQHYQQFSVRALHQLVERCGAKVINHSKNFTNWGQTVIVFQKGNHQNNQFENFPRFTREDLLDSFSIFQSDIQKLKLKSEYLSRGRTIYGYGAAQNFPVFHYFSDKDLPFDVILDDHPLRQDKKFPFVHNVVTRKPGADYSGSVALLTGPDYARVLFSRIGSLRFDHILSPFSSY